MESKPSREGPYNLPPLPGIKWPTVRNEHLKFSE